MERIIKLPDIGEGVTEGEVVEWLKKEGEAVEKDEPVVVVMTDKATVELPSPVKGVLIKQWVEANVIAFVGKPLYSIETEEKEQPQRMQEEVHFELAKKAVVTKGGLATPATRKIARALGVDLAAIHGSGRDGRIEPCDFIPVKKKIDRMEGDEEIVLHGVRREMARRMQDSKRDVPHFSYFTFANAKNLVESYESLKKERSSIKITFMPFFLRALSMTATTYPILNASLDGETLVLHKSHNIGIAMAREEGLIVPVLSHVEAMGMEEIIVAYDALVKEPLQKLMAPERMRGGTLTVSNFGVLGGGGRWATPVILPPQVAILAIARIGKEAVCEGDKIVARETLKLSWSFDHRVIDGNKAAEISERFVELIERPELLM